MDEAAVRDPAKEKPAVHKASARAVCENAFPVLSGARRLLARESITSSAHLPKQ